MAFHPAEINHLVVGDSGSPLAGNHLADTSLSDFNTARTAMASPIIPGEFGNVAIDFGGDQSRSEVKMAAAAAGASNEYVPPEVSGPGCRFDVREDAEHKPYVKVIPPTSGGSCIVEFNEPMPKADY